jgi:hypothetical protein
LHVVLKPDFNRVHVTPPSTAKSWVRHPRKIYSNNEFGATDYKSSGYADSATAGLVDWATGRADVRLRKRIGAMPMNPAAMKWPRNPKTSVGGRLRIARRCGDHYMLPYRFSFN